MEFILVQWIIKNIRHALACGIIADFADIISAIFIAYWFFASC